MRDPLPRSMYEQLRTDYWCARCVFSQLDYQHRLRTPYEELEVSMYWNTYLRYQENTVACPDWFPSFTTGYGNINYNCPPEPVHGVLRSTLFPLSQLICTKCRFVSGAIQSQSTLVFKLTISHGSKTQSMVVS